MAATKGNQFWKLRSKHGRDKLFKTPELLWEAACEYFQWCEENPLLASEAKVVNTGDYQSKVEIVEIPKMRAFTLHGLCLYLGCNTVYFNHFEYGLKGKEDELSKDFSQCLTCIKEVVFEQKFTGAAAGMLNPSFIGKDLGLIDRTETKLHIEQPLFDEEGAGA